MAGGQGAPLVPAFHSLFLNAANECMAVLNIGGIMVGAWLSGRLAGRMAPREQIRLGFAIMVCATTVNLVANIFYTAQASWAMIPLMVYALGWALMERVSLREMLTPA